MSSRLICMLLIVVSLGSSSCIFDGCSEEIKAEVASPDRRVTAILFERNCGATTSYIAHVNLRLSDGEFRGDSYGVIKEGQVFVIRREAQGIKLVWETPSKLVIECPGCLGNPNQKKEDRWQDVGVELRTEQPR
jgi:hypothetical protein